MIKIRLFKILYQERCIGEKMTEITNHDLESLKELATMAIVVGFLYNCFMAFMELIKDGDQKQN